jgi:CxxC motif-containing protein (DUF1111 family)
MKKSALVLSLVLLLVAVMAACRKILPSGPPEDELLAGTLPGLTPSQEREHLIGDALFGRIFSEAEGLGPVFIQNSCSNCHVGNGKGHLSTLLTRFGRKGEVFDYLLPMGGPQLQPRALAGHEGEQLPAEADAVSHRLAPAVMGLGFIAALHDNDILANADSADADGDGISGRPNYIEPRDYFVPGEIHVASQGKYIGRFGKKAEKITLMDQVVFALKQDMGITSDLDTEDIYNPRSGSGTGDQIPDPEVTMSTLNGLVFYMRTLKAPERRNADDPDVRRGEELFAQIGCTSCHKPAFTTSVSDIQALSNKTFHPYSDFLLHDMGSGLNDDYPEGSAEGNEWRTPPLWGLGLAAQSQGGQMFLLHDGRAKSYDEAITLHGGEAASRRAAYFQLSDKERSQLKKFLDSL